jgi:hypothetical protein
MPKSNNDIPSRLYTVAVATSTARGTYGEGGVNTSPNAPKIKSTPRRQSTTTARVPHQRRLGARKANTASAIIGGSGMDVNISLDGISCRDVMVSRAIKHDLGGPVEDSAEDETHNRNSQDQDRNRD